MNTTATVTAMVAAPPRVVIVDDHRLFRSGVRAEIGDQVTVVAEADDVGSAVEAIERWSPDVVLLDVHLPSGSGREVIESVAAAGVDTRFLALSVSDAAEDVIAVVRAGARGYVTKSISGGDLVEAIMRVRDGDAVFSPRLAGFVLDAFAADAVAVAGAESDEDLDRLTAREREVLRHLARGYTYKEIARQLTISIKTVETHASAVLRKLQLSNRPRAEPLGGRPPHLVSEQAATAAQRWDQAMAEWAIPQAILDAAPRQPFVFIPEMFAAAEPGTFELSLSNRPRRGGLGRWGLGARRRLRGRGRSLRGHAYSHQGDRHRPPTPTCWSCSRRPPRSEASPPLWSPARGPRWADETPVADVVVCHNVLYNVTGIAPFVAALDAHARRRVVIEITPKHPQDRRRKLWRHFWDLDRPREPTASTAVDVLVEAGLSPVVEESLLPEDRFASKRSDLEAAHWCRYMCLPPEREAEVAALVAEAPFPRERVTIWWDTDR